MLLSRIDVVVVSDVHLGTPGCHATELLRHLKSVRPRVLVLNGDVVAIWQFRESYWPPSPYDVRLTRSTPNGDASIETVMQPGICVICDPQKLDDRRCLGAPDWIIEILNAGNVSRDTKGEVRPLRKSRRAGILDDGAGAEERHRVPARRNRLLTVARRVLHARPLPVSHAAGVAD